MFYKLVNKENKVVAIAQKPLFYKYSQLTKKLFPSKKDIAEVVSIKGKFYPLQGLEPLEEDAYLLVEVSEEEFYHLSTIISNVPPEISPYIERLRQEKIEELCKECRQKIDEGCSVVLSESTEYFKFSLEDQLNINRLMNQLLIQHSSNKVLYHSTSNKVRYYSEEDFSRIYNAMNKHITYHTTYFNLLKNCINNMYDPKVIKDIKYGYVLDNPKDRQLLNELRR